MESEFLSNNAQSLDEMIFYDKLLKRISYEEWNTLIKDETYCLIKTSRSNCAIETRWIGYNTRKDSERKVFETVLYHGWRCNHVYDEWKLGEEFFFETEQESIEAHLKLLGTLSK